MSWVDITEEQLAEDALTSVKKIQRMRTNPSYPKNLESVIAVCIGMGLPPELSYALIDRSGYTLRVADIEKHLYYKFFINHMYTSTVRECNEYLAARKIPPLAKDE